MLIPWQLFFIMDSVNANTLTEVTTVPINKKLIFTDPDTNEGGIITMENLTKQVLQNLTSQQFALNAGNMTIPAALNALNSESSILSNLLIYRTSGANIKSITISVNKNVNKAFMYAPFIIFGESSFLTGVTCLANSTNKVGDILAEYSFDDASEKVTFSNLKMFANMVIIICYPNISKAEIKENE